MEPPLITPPKITYDLIEVRLATIERAITGIGTFISVGRSDHYFRNPTGRIKAIAVVSGQTVRRGDVLAELESADLKDEVQLQKLNLQKARLAYASVQALADSFAVRLAELDVEAAALRLDQLQRDLEAARHVLAVDQSPASRNRVQEQALAVSLQEIALEKAKIQRDRLIGDPNRRELAAIDVRAAELRLAILERKLDETVLAATLDGVVTFIDQELAEGSRVQPFATVVTVSNPAELQLEYSGHRMLELRVGMTVGVELDDRPYAGTVVMTPLSSEEDTDGLRGKVRIAIDGLPPEVAVGDTAHFIVIQARKENVMVVPKRVIRSYRSRRYVQILDAGVKKERDVEVGIESDTEVEIVTGLRPGDTVIGR